MSTDQRTRPATAHPGFDFADVDPRATSKAWNRFLTDQRLLDPYTPEEAAWIVNHWRNTAAEHPEGLYGAVVMSHNVFTRLVMGQIVQEANTADTMHFRRFETEPEATAWHPRSDLAGHEDERCASQEEAEVGTLQHFFSFCHAD